MKNIFEINSEERSRILNLHETATKNQYLVVEQTQTSFPKQSLGDKFKFGEYDSENVKNSILKLKPQIEAFIKNNGGKKFDVNITSGESQVTNPKGFETKGSLALARANSVKKYFQEIFPDLIKSGQLTIKTPNSVAEVVIGKTPYNKAAGDNKNPELINKYKLEQFVNFDIQGSGSLSNNTSEEVKVKDLCNLKINVTEGQGLPSSNYITTNEVLDGNGEIEFDTGQIPDRLTIVNKNNQIVKDFGYLTTKEHENQYFKYVPLYVYQLTRLKGKAPVSGNKLITIKVKTFEELINSLLRNPSVIPSQKEMVKAGEKELYQGYEQLKRLFDKGVREFVLYDIQTSPFKTTFSVKKGDYKVVVYSPVGKTGYTLTGFCYP